MRNLCQAEFLRDPLVFRWSRKVCATIFLAEKANEASAQKCTIVVMSDGEDCKELAD